MRQLLLTVHLLFLFAVVPLLAGCNMTSGKMHQQLGSTYYKRGQLQQAQNEFKRALADNPENATHAHNLATTMSKQGNMVAAEQMFRKAIATDANHQPAYHGLAKLLQLEGRTTEAQSLLSNWQQTNPDSAAPYVEMAAVQNQMNDIKGAEQSLRTALEKQPNHPIAMSKLGEILENNGRVEEAKVMYQRSLASNMQQPEVYRRLAAIQQIPKASITSITPGSQTALMSVPPVPIKVQPLPPYEQPLPWSASLRQQTATPLFQTFPATPAAEVLPAK